MKLSQSVSQLTHHDEVVQHFVGALDVASTDAVVEQTHGDVVPDGRAVLLRVQCIVHQVAQQLRKIHNRINNLSL